MAGALLKLRIRSYGVGFGDCFLLTFVYEDSERHMLIDFGTTERPKANIAPKKLKLDIAQHIAATCGGKLHAVVATHRHADHINGFDSAGAGPGKIIRDLKPVVALLPWTEDPDAPADWDGASALTLRGADRAFICALRSMDRTARAIREELNALGLDSSSLALNQISNKDALENLQTMAPAGATFYVRHGDSKPQETLAELFPGVHFDILGPPTVEQKADIGTMRSRHTDEFWHFASLWRMYGIAGDKLLSGDRPLFPGQELGDSVPPEAAWFVHRMKQSRAAQLLRVVTAMNDALNNTSIILMVRALGKKFLFPGDAQWENWEFALQHNAEALKDVALYKVGHHGSLNATPKTLWELITKGRTREDLSTLLSTVTDSKHGSEDAGTEVPRSKLVDELKLKSVFHTTQSLEKTSDLFLDLVYT